MQRNKISLLVLDGGFSVATARQHSLPVGFLFMPTKAEYLKHRDKNLAYAKKYRQENREKILTKTRTDAYRKWHTDYERKRRAKNPERYREATRRWRQNNRAKLLASRVASQRKRETRCKATPEQLALIVKFITSIKSKSAAICYYCQRRVSTKRIHFDHIIALDNGGSHDVSNLCVSCPLCNLSKSNRPVESLTIDQKLLNL